MTGENADVVLVWGLGGPPLRTRALHGRHGHSRPAHGGELPQGALIRNKKAAGRNKDLADVEELERDPT